MILQHRQHGMVSPELRQYLNERYGYNLSHGILKTLRLDRTDIDIDVGQKRNNGTGLVHRVLRSAFMKCDRHPVTGGVVRREEAEGQAVHLEGEAEDRRGLRPVERERHVITGMKNQPKEFDPFESVLWHEVEIPLELVDPMFFRERKEAVRLPMEEGGLPFDVEFRPGRMNLKDYWIARVTKARYADQKNPKAIIPCVCGRVWDDLYCDICHPGDVETIGFESEEDYTCE